MGKRSRKRTGPRGPVARSGPPPAPARPAPPDRRARKQEAPPAPWAPVPLTELAIFAGMVLIVLAFAVGGDRTGLLLAVGFALVTLAGLELAAREHLAGYRSHSTLLAGAGAILVTIPFFFLDAPYEVLLIVGVACFGAFFGGLRSLFARRTGGLGFRA